MAWLDANQPDDVANCVIHNDFKIDNMVFAKDDPTRVVGVLDWEMATLGDPLMDLAGAIAFWVQADDSEEVQLMRRVPTHLPGMITREEFVQRYLDRMGFSLTRRPVALLRGLRALPQRGHRAADLLPLLPQADDQRAVRAVRSRRADPRPPDRGAAVVSVVLLVRHGQASFGAADYDLLSAEGERAVPDPRCCPRRARDRADARRTRRP